MNLQVVTQPLLDKVIDETKKSPRLCMNYIFHTDLGDK